MSDCLADKIIEKLNNLLESPAVNNSNEAKILVGNLISDFEKVKKINDEMSGVSTVPMNNFVELIKAINSPNNGLPKREEGVVGVNHTGGAYGADALWADMFRSAGVKNIHYRPIDDTGTKKTKELKNKKDTVIKVTPEENSTGDALNRGLKNGSSTLNNRNFVQVYNAEGVYAVAPIVNGVVTGGTGSAVRIAQALGRDVYVLDTETVNWYKYDTNTQAYVELPENTFPKNYPSFAAIGTRGIESYTKGTGENVNGKPVFKKTSVHKNTKEILSKMKDFVKQWELEIFKKGETKVAENVTDTKPNINKDAEFPPDIVYDSPSYKNFVKEVEALVGEKGYNKKPIRITKSVDRAHRFLRDVMLKKERPKKVADNSSIALYSGDSHSIEFADFDGFLKEVGRVANTLERSEKDTIKTKETLTSYVKALKIHSFNPYLVKAHELIHGGTLTFMRNNPKDSKTVYINNLYKKLLKDSETNPQLGNIQMGYWKTNVDEFIAVALSNIDMMKYLNDIKASNNTTVWDKFVNTVLSAVKDILSIKDDSELKMLLQLIAEMNSENSPVETSLTSKPAENVNNMLNDPKNRDKIEELSNVKTMTDCK